MSWKNFQVLLDRLKGWGHFLFFHLKGEPLIHPEIKPMAEEAHQKGFELNLTTNGRELGAHPWIWTEGVVRQLNISLHSWESGFSRSWGQALLEGIRNRRDETAPYVNLRYWTEGTGDVQGVYDWLTQVWPHFTPGAKNLVLEPGVFFQGAESFDWPRLDSQDPSDPRGFCLGLRDQIGILWDGCVVPCCLDDQASIPLGNLLNQSLEEILNSERAQRLLEGFGKRQALEPLCQKCTFKNRFS